MKLNLQLLAHYLKSDTDIMKVSIDYNSLVRKHVLYATFKGISARNGNSFWTDLDTMSIAENGHLDRNIHNKCMMSDRLFDLLNILIEYCDKESSCYGKPIPKLRMSSNRQSFWKRITGW